MLISREPEFGPSHSYKNCKDHKIPNFSFQNLNSLHVPSKQPASIRTLHCKRLISAIMLPPKEVANNAKTTHLHSDIDIVTLSTELCYYCKQSICVCDGKPFKNSTRGSETLQVGQGITDALSPLKKPAMQSKDDSPRLQTNSTLAACPLCKMHPCMCQRSRPTSRTPDPTDDGDRLCVICWIYGCTKHPKSN